MGPELPAYQLVVHLGTCFGNWWRTLGHAGATAGAPWVSGSSGLRLLVRPETCFDNSWCTLRQNLQLLVHLRTKTGLIWTQIAPAVAVYVPYCTIRCSGKFQIQTAYTAASSKFNQQMQHGWFRGYRIAVSFGFPCLETAFKKEAEFNFKRKSQRTD